MAVSSAAKSGLTTFNKFQKTSTGNFAQQFIVTGASGTVLTSPDGTTWTSRSGLPAQTITAPHRNGNLLCVFDASNNRWTSADGATWAKNGQGALNQASGGISIAKAAFDSVDKTVNLFSQNVVTNGFGNMFDVTNATSIGDATVIGSNPKSSGYATNGSVFLFSGVSSTNYLWKSTTTKGGTIAAQAYGSSTGSLGVVYGAGLFAVSDSNGTGVWTSPDGTTWTGRGTAGKYIYFQNNLFLVTDGTSLWTSPDAITWTSRTVTGIGANSPISSIVYGNGVYVLVSNGGFIATSPDGTTWTARTSGTANQLNGVYFG